VRPSLLAFSPDSRTLHLITSSYEPPIEVHRWDAATGDRLPARRLAGGTDAPRAFSPDGALCVSADGPEVVLWDSATGAQRSRFTAKDETHGLLVARHAEVVVQKTQGESVWIYRQADGAWNGEVLFESNGSSIVLGRRVAGQEMALSADGRRVALNVEGSVRVFETATRRQIARLPASGEAVTWLAFSPDGAALALGQSDGGIVVHRVAGRITPVVHD
jgi:WD40 repeat protein